MRSGAVGVIRTAGEFEMPHKVIPIGRFDAPTTPPPSTVASGTAILAFESCAAATLSYNFSGGSSANAVGTILLRRVGPVPAGCAM